MARVSLTKDTGTTVRIATIRVRAGSLNTDTQVGTDSVIQSSAVASTAYFGDAFILGEYTNTSTAAKTFTVRGFVGAGNSTANWVLEAVELLQVGGGGGGGTGIPATLIDAKGDLIVGTANDTAARLAVGADTTILMADSTQAGGLVWKASGASPTVNSVVTRDANGRFTVPDPVFTQDPVSKTYLDGIVFPGPYASGTPTWRAPYVQANSTITPTLGRLQLHPVLVDSFKALTGLACLVTTAASTGSVFVCIYSDNGSFFPGTLIQSISASMTATGVASGITGNTGVSARYYWVGILPVGTGAPQFEAATIQRDWSVMPYGTGTTPSVNAGNDGRIAYQDSLSTPPSTFAGSLAGDFNSGKLPSWVALRIA